MRGCAAARCTWVRGAPSGSNRSAVRCSRRWSRLVCAPGPRRAAARMRRALVGCCVGVDVMVLLGHLREEEGESVEEVLPWSGAPSVAMPAAMRRRRLRAVTSLLMVESRRARAVPGCAASRSTLASSTTHSLVSISV